MAVNEERRMTPTRRPSMSRGGPCSGRGRGGGPRYGRSSSDEREEEEARAWGREAVTSASSRGEGRRPVRASLMRGTPARLETDVEEE